MGVPRGTGREVTETWVCLPLATLLFLEWCGTTFSHGLICMIEESMLPLDDTDRVIHLHHRGVGCFV